MSPRPRRLPARTVTFTALLAIAGCRTSAALPESTARSDRQRLLAFTLDEAAERLAPGARFEQVLNLLDAEGEPSGIGFNHPLPVQPTLGDDLDRYFARACNARAMSSAGFDPPDDDRTLVVLYEHRDGHSEELRYPILRGGDTVRFGPPEIFPREPSVFVDLDAD